MMLFPDRNLKIAIFGKGKNFNRWRALITERTGPVRPPRRLTI